jgi:SAM-dependent methyltransferase
LQHNLYSSLRNLKKFLGYIYGSVSFAGKKVLDIGGGDGLLSFYAIYRGADKAVCLEPESAGSSTGIKQRFNKVCTALGYADRALLLPVTFQDYDPSADKFDIVISRNSINHLNEEACITLHQKYESRSIYVDIFRRLKSMLNPGAMVIICDCSRYNFFQLLDLQNPLARTIEWHKHQDPALWIKLLKEAGFIQPAIRWSSFNSLGKFGQLLLGNKIAAYFLYSHFCLTIRNP